MAGVSMSIKLRAFELEGDEGGPPAISDAAGSSKDVAEAGLEGRLGSDDRSDDDRVNVETAIGLRPGLRPRSQLLRSANVILSVLSMRPTNTVTYCPGSPYCQHDL